MRSSAGPKPPGTVGHWAGKTCPGKNQRSPMPQPVRQKLTSVNHDVPLPRLLTGAALAATLVVGLAAAGCGSSSSSSKSTSSTPTTAVTKAAFLAKANAICTQGNKQSAAAGAKLGKSPSQAQVIASVKRT